MLKALRVIFAIVCVTAVTLLFVDFTGFAADHWSWLAKIQFVPALLSLNLIVIAALVVLTLVFGRLYCSVICPLGVFQDFVNWFHNHFGGKRAKRINRFRYHAPYKKLRLTFLTLFVVMIAVGIVGLSSAAFAVAGLIEPYSAYGRIATQLFAPVFDAGNNVLADMTAASDNYYFYHVVPRFAWPVFIVAALTFIVVVAFSWTAGRNYCNIVCPVGTVLGYLSKYSLLKPVIDKSKCNGCRKCERNCKASCIDGHNHTIDYTRCVTCLDCIGNCSQHAISYRPASREKAADDKTEVKRSAQTDTGRRSFIITGAVLAGGLAARAAVKGDGGLAPVKNKKRPDRETQVVPPGAISISHLNARCTSCQLCINSCPEEVLKPSTDIESFMHPVSYYTDGWCRPDCTTCGDVCPAGAIVSLDAAEKSSTKIGTAKVDLETCISASAGQQCGNCERHCPAGAITMAPVSDTPGAHLRPVVDEAACIGCGACEYHCPVGTAGIIRADRSAIHVEGVDVHRLI